MMRFISLIGILAIPFLIFSLTDDPNTRLKKIVSQINDQKKNLNEIKQKLEEHRNTLLKLQNKKKTLQEEHSFLEKELELTRKYIEELKRTESNVDSNIMTIAHSISIIEKRLVEKKESLKELILANYKTNRYTEIDALFEATTPHNFMQKIKWMHNITEYTNNIIEYIRDQRQIVAFGSEILKNYSGVIRKIKDEKKKEESIFQKEFKKQQKLIKSITDKEEKTAFELRQFETREQVMSELIALLEEKRKIAEKETVSVEAAEQKLPNLNSSKGNLIWPLKGPLIKTFGKIYDKKYHTTLYNPGIDIGASFSENVVATAQGKIEIIKWMNGYGNLIVINHQNGYYSIYAHLSRFSVKVGEKINAGQIIGYAGETGSFEGQKLHFELRKGSQPLNPLEWLSK